MSGGPETEDRGRNVRVEQATIIEGVDSIIPRASIHERNRALLTVLTGELCGTIIKIEGDELTLGRSEEATTVIPDPKLSRVHARIFRGPEGTFMLEDAGSTNGTFLGTERLEGARPLADGARIGLGRKTILRFSMSDRLEEEAALRVYESALLDRLTGVYNRGVFDDRLESELAFAHRHESALTLLIFDVDHFKRFNDEHGHQAGDAVLRVIAEHVKEALRTEDMLARYGGEEFAIIARGTPESRARALAERVRVAVEGIRIPWGESELRVTISVGTATASPTLRFDSVGALVSKADSGLYEAKRRGRNCIVTAAELEG